MIDFLTSLTARSFSSEAVIRPRVASLFEPIRSFDTALREPVAAQPMQTALSREHEVEPVADLKINRRPSALRESQTTGVKHSADDNPVSVPGPRPRGNSVLRKPAVEPDYEWEQEDTTPAATAQPQRPTRSQEESLTYAHSSLRPELEDVAARPESARPKAASSARNGFLEKEHRGLVSAPKAVAELATQMKSAALAMNVPGAGREKAGSTWPASATVPDPDVQVTIGRIEVRATSESNKKIGRPRAASPVMSLEEYLHRRAQRGGQ
jgi:hypothetical protein